MKPATQKIICALCLIFIMGKAYSQTPAIDSLIFDIEEFYDTLDYSTMETNNNLNKGFLTGSFFEAWNDSVPMVFDFFTFDVARTPFMRTDSSIQIPNADSIASYNSIYSSDEQISTIAIPVMFMQGEYIKDTVVKLFVDSGHPISFEKFNFLCAAPSQPYASQGQVKFKINPNLLFISGNINSLEVNFDDNQGFRSQSLTNENINSVQYDSPGEKNLIFRVIDSIGDTTISYSSFEIWSVISMANGSIYGTVEPDSVISGSRHSTGTSAGMDYRLYPGIDGVLNKPFIFVEGFDVMNTTSALKSAVKIKYYISHLTANGYDVYVTNFTGGNISIYDNVKYLKKFLKTVVHKPGSTGNIGNHEGLMLCLSMGGIITRIALKELENEGFDHKIGTYITSDTPHRGASLAPYLQMAFEDLTDNLPLWILHFNNYYGVIALLSEDKNLPTKAKVHGAIHSDAARQMIVNHLDGSSDYFSMQSYLDQLGWPSQPRKIALLCGSNQAIDHGFNPGDKILDGRIYLPPSNYFDFWGKVSPLNETNYKYWQMAKISGKLWGNKLLTAKRDFDDKAWDTAPGSKLVGTKKHWNYLTIDPPNMVSTLSAMSVNNSYYIGSNFYSYNKNNGHGKSYFISNGITPFDDVYSINGSVEEPNEQNLKHPYIFKEPIIMDIILNQELMMSDYYLQNRTFTHDRDIECAGTMKVGYSVVPLNRLLINFNNYPISSVTSETEKTIDNGNVVVPSGKSLNLEARTSIKLIDGFTAQSGSNFTAKLDPQNPNTRSSKNELVVCSHIVKRTQTLSENIYALSDKNNGAEWKLTGYETNLTGSGNEFTIPSNLKKGQYSLKAIVPECPVSSIVINVEKQDLEEPIEEKVSSLSGISVVQIIPNPSNNVVQVSCKIGMREIELTDQRGKQFFVNSYQSTPFSISLNVSEYSSGLYLLKVKLNNGTYETKRLVIQH